MNKEVRGKIRALLTGGAVKHFSAAPTCASFSRAITPVVRSKLFPSGLPNLFKVQPNMVAKVAEGNSFCAWLSELVEICCILNILFWIENPDSSYLWLQPSFTEVAQHHSLKFYRCDFCFFGAKWRKRTKFCTNNGCLVEMKDLCRGGHTHVVLRGRSSFHKCSWTRLAEAYPRKLCSKLAWAAAYELALLPRRVHRRIGEAKNPGPRRTFRSRLSGDLEAVELI